MTFSLVSVEFWDCACSFGFTHTLRASGDSLSMFSEPIGDVLTGLAILSNSALALDICSPLFRFFSLILRPDILDFFNWRMRSNW